MVWRPDNSLEGLWLWDLASTTPGLAKSCLFDFIISYFLFYFICRWQNGVELVMADMRDWEAPEQADFIVSELLGSLADNELSPECLDGAQRFLAPQGVFIPSSYKSYIQPITSAKLWNDVRVSHVPGSW